MEAKEKALELIDKFQPHVQYWDCYHDVPLEEKHAIQCALICVEEILSVIDIYPRHQMSQSEIETVDYWQSVKQELIKLK